MSAARVSQRAPPETPVEQAMRRGLGSRAALERDLIASRTSAAADRPAPREPTQSPRPSDEDARRAIIALTVVEYERLLTHAHAEVASDPLLGWRAVAIIRTLGECGLRAEELCQLQRRDYRPTRKGARKRELHIRHGKGSQTRPVPASQNVRRAVVRWDQLRRKQTPGTQGQPVENEPLFVTIGVRRRDGGYSALGRQVTYDTIDEVVKRLGERAELPAEKRHPHVLRHTFATRYYRRHKDLAGLQRLLGHADATFAREAL